MRKNETTGHSIGVMFTVLERTYHNRAMKFILFLICCASLSVAGWAQSSSPSPDSPKADAQKPGTKEAQSEPEEAKPIKDNNQLQLR
jgi:hypothetical protein